MPGEVGCNFFGFHTIMFFFSGVVVDFGAFTFSFHTFGGIT